MKKTVWKILFGFVLCSTFVAVLLLLINSFVLAWIGSDTNNDYRQSPERLLDMVEEALTEKGIGVSTGLLAEDEWCILIGEGGDVIWEEQMPADIPTHYTINDVASMTRWFLEDYPVYVRTTEMGLLVVGEPKNSVGKYDMVYSMDWFDSLPERILRIFLLNLGLAALLSSLFSVHLYGRLKVLTEGVWDLSQEKPVRLPEKGLFRDLSRSINYTARSIERKNQQLAQKETARNNWVAGISHDIRTPLSMILGYADELSRDGSLLAEQRKKAGVIAAQSMRIKRMVEDLNLMSSLEYDMQPAERKPVVLCRLLRRLVSEMINNGLEEKYEIHLELTEEDAVILGDERLLERAVENILHNAVEHNPKGCRIRISEGKVQERAYIVIADNGVGVPPEVLEKIKEMPKGTHGLGLPLAYRITEVHGGTLVAGNHQGFFVRMVFPLYQEQKTRQKKS